MILLQDRLITSCKLATCHDSRLVWLVVNSSNGDEVLLVAVTADSTAAAVDAVQPGQSVLSLALQHLLTV
jgi:hypothetical protein